VARKPKQIMHIAVDTREQKPYKFKKTVKPSNGIEFDIERTTLQTGDYGLVKPMLAETSDLIALERKSLADLFSTVSQGRFRFENEMKRMTQYGYAAIIIEADFAMMCNPNAYLKWPTGMDTKSMFATLIAFSTRYNVHLWPCPTREFAEAVTYRLLERWFRDHTDIFIP